MEYRNIGGRSNKKYYSNKSNSNRYKFLDNYSNDINQLLSGIADADREIDKLKKEHDKLSRKQMQTLEDIEKQRDNFQKRLNRIGNKTKQNLTSTDALNNYNESLLQDIQHEQKKYKNLSTWYADNQETKLINRMNTVRSQLTNDYINKNAYDAKGNYIGLTSKQTKAMNDEINKKLTEQFGKDIDKFGTKVALFGVAADVINKGIEILKKLGLEGINKQANVYEKTFENISVRTGLTRSQYYDAQRGLQVQLSNRGLFNNVASSDVQQMWNTMATNGINLTNAGAANEAQLYARAIDMVVTNKIVPYLDMSSQSLNILDQRLNGKFIQDIRGINLANNEIAGNNYITEELLKQIIDQVQPMSDEALENLAASSTEVTSLINQLAPIMGKDAATSYAKQWFKADKYSDQMLRSGSLTEKMSITTALANNTNYHNPSQAAKYIIDSLQNDVWLTSMGMGYDSALAGLVTNTIGTATGNIERQRGLDTLLQSGKLSDIIANSKLSPEEYAEYVRQATDTFSNDQNQTNEQLQNITVENFMNRLAVVKEWLGNYADVIKVAIEGISSILVGKIVLGGIGKGVSALSGIGSAGMSVASSSGGLFATLGPMAMGIAGIALGTAYISKQISAQRIKEGNTYSNYSNNALQNYESGNSSASEYIGNLNTEQDIAKGTDDTNLWSLIGRAAKVRVSYNVTGDKDKGFNVNWYGNIGDNAYNYLKDADSSTLNNLGIEPHWYSSRKDEALDALNKFKKRKDYKGYNRIKTWILRQHLMSMGNTIDMGEVASALAVASYYNGVYDLDAIKSPINEYLGVTLPNTKEGVKTILDAAGITHATELQKVYRLFDNKSMDYYLMKGDNSWMWYPSDDTGLNNIRKDFNLHRYGLESVPYDNYPALLHENEAVLTASTANELRNLIVEYRETNNQSINFEAIIQRQTTSLVNKLDSVISAINNISIPIGQSRLSSVQNKLMNSMTTISSTKSFA